EWATAAHGEAQPTTDIPLSPQAARWWLKNQGATDVHYTQFMGKDNVYFHTLSFPCTLIGSGEPWNPVSTLKSYNWLTYYGGKFSTSQGVGIFTDKALELLPADYWRYYLIARAPEGDDSEFRWTDLQSVVNKDLADVLGNFINRTLTFNAKHHGTSLPPLGEVTAMETQLHQNLQTTLQKLSHHLQEAEMRKSAEALRELWSLGNEYLAAAEPWKELKTNPERAQTILHTAIQLIPFYAATMAPLIPHTAEKIIALFPQLQTPAFQAYPWPQNSLPNSAITQVATPSEVLFPKISDEQVAEWEAQFGNSKV
ncbi:MAG: methionine--tRNA ligase, partial [Proteobacteria bacterium]|nr:methionine--tRNA ligase [Pseudomonadota bacterium]